MNDWARTPGADKNDAATMAAAIHLEIMSNILPVNLDAKLDGRTCAVNPSKRGKARQQPHGRPAQTRKARGTGEARRYPRSARRRSSERMRCAGILIKHDNVDKRSQALTRRRREIGPAWPACASRSLLPRRTSVAARHCARHL